MTVPQPTFAPGRRLGRHAWRAAGAALVLAVLLSLAPSRAVAQAEAPTPGVIVSVNGNEFRKMSTGKKIKTIRNSNPERVNVVPTTSPNEVVIVGVAPGIARVTLIDENDAQDVIEVVVVAFDIRQLQEVLRKAVPTARVRPVPAGNNAIILQGTVDRAEDAPLAQQAAQSVVGAVQVINALRVGGVQQVQLDVVVAAVSRSELRAMVFNFFASSENFFLGSTVGQAVINPVQVGVGSQFLNVGGVLQGVPGTPNGLPTNFLVGVLHNNWGFLQFLQALRTEGVLKLMAEPRLVTMSGRQASFLSGGEQAVPVPAGLGQVGVQFEEFGTRLNFIPIVLGNGKIHLEVEPEVSALDPASGTVINGTNVPGRTTQRVRTTVELEAGQTFVIGGLIQHVVQGNTQKVPILGDLPFVGTAFSSKSFNETEQELLILVTPHLVDGQSCDQAPKILPGQETRSPDDFELFLEGILEAPRGPRDVCQGKTYVPAYKNGPTAGQFPCAGGDGHGGGHCGGHGRMGCPTDAAMPGVLPEQAPMPMPREKVIHKPDAARKMTPSQTPEAEAGARETDPARPPEPVTPASLPPTEAPEKP